MSAEVAAQQDASLFEHFRNTEVTVFGITGTIESLVKLCPVPAEQMTLEARDQFTAKVVIESGIEIPPELAASLETKPDLSESQPPDKKLDVAPLVVVEELAPPDKIVSKPVSEHAVEPAVEITPSPELVMYKLRANLEAKILLDPPPDFFEQPAVEFDEPRLIQPVVQSTEKVTRSDPPPEIARAVFDTAPVAEAEQPASFTETVLQPVDEVKPMPDTEQVPPRPEPLKGLRPPLVIEIEPIAGSETTETIRLPVEGEVAPTVEAVAIVEVLESDPASEQAEIGGAVDVVEAAEIAEPDPTLFELGEGEATELYDRLADDSIEAVRPAAELVEMRRVDPGAEDESEPFAASLPETVQQRIAEYQTVAEPEAVIALQSLEAALETAITQFEELSIAEFAEPEKVAEVEAIAIELYEELLQKIGLESPEEQEPLIRQFVVLLRQKIELQKSDETTARFIADDEGTHEHKRQLRLSSVTRDLSKLSRYILGKLAVRQALPAFV